jgi:hypothetical protein
MLKKQVTHWIGKFMIVKHENNRLREKAAKDSETIEKLRKHIRRLADELYCGSSVEDEVELYHEAQEALAEAETERNYDVAQAKIKEYTKETAEC